MYGDDLSHYQPYVVIANPITPHVGLQPLWRTPHLWRTVAFEHGAVFKDDNARSNMQTTAAGACLVKVRVRNRVRVGVSRARVMVRVRVRALLSVMLVLAISSVVSLPARVGARFGARVVARVGPRLFSEQHKGPATEMAPPSSASFRTNVLCTMRTWLPVLGLGLELVSKFWLG